MIDGIVRDRVKELRRVRAGDLRPHPRNWRGHGERQRSALEEVLNAVGFAGALLAREMESGELELIDGHLRAETTPETEVPVLVLDVTAEEGELILATHDPLGALAERNDAAAESLAGSLAERNAALAELLRRDPGVGVGERSFLAERKEIELPELYQVVVECADEAEQREVYERLRDEGRTCRAMVL